LSAVWQVLPPLGRIPDPEKEQRRQRAIARDCAGHSAVARTVAYSVGMWTLTLPRETWQRIIEALRERTIPYMLEHADILEQRLIQAPADQPTVRMSMSDDLFSRRVWWAAWRLGIRLPVTRG
jgi:hypothetical protein